MLSFRNIFNLVEWLKKSKYKNNMKSYVVFDTTSGATCGTAYHTWYCVWFQIPYTVPYVYHLHIPKRSCTSSPPEIPLSTPPEVFWISFHIYFACLDTTVGWKLWFNIVYYVLYISWVQFWSSYPSFGYS